MAAPLTLADRPRIATERLVLRRPDESDVDAIVAIVGDWEVACRLSRVPHPYGPADARFFLEQIVPDEWVWAITARDDDEMIGAVGLSPEAETVELGYWLAKPFWGRGMMTEVAGAILSFGFDSLRLARIDAGYFAENPASGRVLEKLGFIETGRAMRPCMASGSEMAAVEMMLSAERWRGAAPAKSLR